jgi:hypothetical protein
VSRVERREDETIERRRGAKVAHRFVLGGSDLGCFAIFVVNAEAGPVN